MRIDETRVVADGEWLYDSIMPCRVVILSESIFPGSGDYEDPSEIAEDRDVPCFSVWYQNLTYRKDFNAGGGCYMTLEEAIEGVEETVNNDVIWKKA